MTGFIFTVAGVVARSARVVWGRMGDRIGYRRLLIGMALGAGLIYIPQALVTSVIQLIVLRGMLGIFDGGLLPSANAVIATQTAEKPADQESHGTTYGLVYLANGMGFALGPLTGGLLAAASRPAQRVLRHRGHPARNRRLSALRLARPEASLNVPLTRTCAARHRYSRTARTG